MHDKPALNASVRPKRTLGQPPEDLSAHFLRLGSEVLLLLSFPIPAGDVLGVLTAAEREVVGLVASGATNLDIAHRRGVSKNTVAKQIAAVFRKVNVTSRFELIAVLSGASVLSTACAPGQAARSPTGSSSVVSCGFQPPRVGRSQK